MRMKKNISTKNVTAKTEVGDHFCSCCGGGWYWGALLLLVGLLFLAKGFGWVTLNVSILPVLLIILGFWLLLKGHRKTC